MCPRADVDPCEFEMVLVMLLASTVVSKEL